MQDVQSQLQSAGLDISGPLEIGRLIRCKVEGDTGSKQSGWYVLHEITLDQGDRIIVGRYGNWKQYGAESLKIDFDKPSLSDSERSRIKAEQDRLRKQAEKEKAERAKNAASRALHIWEKLPDSGLSHYLKKKKVGAYGLKFSRGSIVVPVRKAGELVGLQFIYPDGSKKFLTGTPKQGAWHMIGDPAESLRVWIAEGYATAASVYMALGEPVAVAFDAGNLLPVAKALRSVFPDKQIAIAADNDHATKGNPGLTKAKHAAIAVGGFVAVPQFEDVA